MKKLLIALTLLQLNAAAQQVPRTVIAEHFTNTYCSVCASRNPGFYGNLVNFGEVLHIAYHPSSPYPACPLNMHNVAENNARTNYYGVYGSTPRLVIQGVALSSGANYADPAIFTGVQGQTSSFSLRVEIGAKGADSVTATIVVKKVDNSSVTDLLLYGVLAEDTVFFTAANGEPNSRDVFRKSLFGAPMSITAPVAVGDSTVYTATHEVNSAWARQHIYAMAMLQKTDKAMEQAARSGNMPGAAGMTPMAGKGMVTLYPNPAGEAVYVKGVSGWPRQAVVCDMNGRRLKTVTLNNAASFIDVSGMAAGNYVLKVADTDREYTLPFTKSGR